MQIPLAGFPPGDYELRLTVRDLVSGETRELPEPFVIVAPARAAS